MAGAKQEKTLPTLEAGHPSLRDWLLPATPHSPDDNKFTLERAELGKQLFFDPRLSASGQSNCAWCHTPERTFSDGLPTSVMLGGKVMRVASPALTNVGYNRIQMWDGRNRTLEDQAFDGQSTNSDLNLGNPIAPVGVIKRLNGIKSYTDAFAKTYPGEGLTRKTVAKAIASFERTLISNDSPFDRWVRGDKAAMNTQQVNGFRLFLDKKKGNCETCHNAPNFTDDGFHNIGLKSFGSGNHLPGRFKHRPLKLLDGAFKTPTLRNITHSAPYFHDGSAKTLADVIDHYADGGVVKTNLSPSFIEVDLIEQETKDLLAFMHALTTPQKPFVYPVLPQE